MAGNSRRNRRKLDDHDHLPAFHLGHLFDRAQLFEIVPYPGEKLRAQFLVRHFPTSESQRHFGLVAVFEEFAQLAHLHIVVAFFRARPELDFLDLHLLLLALRRLLLLVLLKHEFAEIHDSANRWFSVR